MIFIDTGAFLARYLPRDQHHEAAVAGWNELASRPWRCVTSDLVISETLTLLGRRASYSFAAQRGRALLASSKLEVLRTVRAQDFEALLLLEKYADQAVSYADCVSFVLMKTHRVRRAFTFDRHFALAGFEIWEP